jgi:TRAP-type C4-dicarboxylate transport system permease small subunit
MKRIFRISDWIIQKFLYVGAAAVIFTMFYTTANVILRVFKRPMSGDIEITVSALVCIVYATIAACVLSDAHIRIELFKKWPWMDHVNNLVASATALVISFQAFRQVSTAVRMHVTSTLLGIPRAPFLFFAALGFLLFAHAVLSVEYRLILSRAAGRRLADSSSGALLHGTEEQ